MRKFALFCGLLLVLSCSTLIPDYTDKKRISTSSQPKISVRVIPFGTFCADSYSTELGKEYRTVMILVDRLGLEPAEIHITINGAVEQTFTEDTSFRLDFMAGVGQHNIVVTAPEGEIRRGVLVYPKEVC